MLAGIRELEGREADCFVRLDTGAFDLEMCSGTAGGLGSSKWGLRHFRSLGDGFELLPSGNNAIGGFYGPFFTPENGLINPPEHTVVRIETIERGPVLHHYRMHGTVSGRAPRRAEGQKLRHRLSASPTARPSSSGARTGWTTSGPSSTAGR